MRIGSQAKFYHQGAGTKHICSLMTNEIVTLEM